MSHFLILIYRSVVLVAGPIGLEQKDPSSNKLLATYFYKDMDGISEVSDYPGGFVITKSHFGRMHMFASEGEQIILEYDSCILFMIFLIRPRGYHQEATGGRG